jgi:hypothetical protein
MKGIIAKARRPFKSLVIHLYPDLDDVSRWDGAAKVIHERSGDVVSTPSRKVLQKSDWSELSWHAPYPCVAHLDLPQSQ